MCSNEEEIESSLSQYKIQVTQIEDALKQSFSEDLFQLKSDMLELIKLTEESLLSLKKSKLLAMLEASTDENETHSDGSLKQTSQVITSENSKSGGSIDVDDDNDVDDDGLIGFKCRAPFSHDWGELSYHNAVVFSVEPQKDDEQQMVRLLFCNPTHKSMKFCPYLCDGHCKFEDETCKFSHGYIIPVSNLEPFKEPNFENVSVGSKCLAKDSDELWYKATIVDLFDDEKIQVMFDANHSLATVELGDIFPSSQDSDEEPESSEDESDVVILPAEETNNLNIKTTDVLGHWEKHTKGIGSKLMLKMGYVIGQGLGKNCNGRAVPVPIEVLPRGKSLDKIMEAKKNKTHPSTFKTKVKFLNKPIESNKATTASVFDVINSKLSLHNKTEKLGDDNSTNHKDLSKKSDKQINIQLRKTTDELRRSDEELCKLKYSYERNLKRGDGVTAKKFQEKIRKVVCYQDVLKKSEKALNYHKHLRESRRLKEF